MEVVEVNIFKDADGAGKQIPMLDRLWQAECRLERSYARAQRELQRLQASRPQAVPQPEEAAPAPQPVAEEEAASTAGSPVVGQAVSPAGQAATAPSATPPAPGTLTELETETTDGLGSMETSR